jgi:hypothetical protein
MPDSMLKTYQWESQAHLDKLLSVIPDWNPESIHDWLERNWQMLYNNTIKDMQNEI